MEDLKENEHHVRRKRDLTITRRCGESFYLNGPDGPEIVIKEVRGRQVRVTIRAHPEVRILRKELLLKEEHDESQRSCQDDKRSQT